jgi:6-phosphofructokinase
MEAGLLRYEDDPAGASVVCLKGKPDMVLIGEQGEDNNNPRIIPIEFKSTHKVLADMETIVTRYNQAVREMHGKKGKAAQKKKKKAKALTGQGDQQSEQKKANQVERTIEWCNIAQLLAQILGYNMVGVLSSGTRAYFICVNNARVPSITNAWRVGKENYLRAWFHFFKVAHAAEK